MESDDEKRARRNAYQRERHRQNPERAKEYNRRWRAAHPEQWAEIQRKARERRPPGESAERSRAWRAANPNADREHYAANRERIRAQMRDYYARNAEKIKARNNAYAARPESKILARRRLLAKKYGMSLEEYTARGDALGWLCGSCGGEPNTLGLVVDHDHETGAVRGLLCSRCNSALGLLGDSLAKVEALVRYLAP